jgi:hypothetical protein
MSLQKIQQRLKAPKNQYNNFGKYAYRNQEDILEAVKPLLAEYQYSLNVSDSIELVGSRYYIKAVAAIFDESGKTIAASTAFAREPETKKGMDEAQITGAASSYARKYALNGLFAIDDCKDADSHKPENGNTGASSVPNYITENQISQIIDMINDKQVDQAAFLKYMGVAKVGQILAKDFNKAIEALSKAKGGTK